MIREESVTISHLPSGLRLVTEVMPHLSTAALGVWVATGSRHEKPNEHGLAHLLEHMAFKGTKRRTARQIAEEIESVGGDLNAETNTERTSYYVRLMGEDAPLALDLIADILAEPLFDKEELKREKGVILQEIGAYEDTPDDLVFDMVLEAAYHQDPIGRRILGTPQSVRAQTENSMRGFLARRYRAPEMVIAASGAVDHQAILADVEKYFAAFPQGAAEAVAPAHWTGGDTRSVKPLEQAHLALAFQGLSFRDPRHYALHVFSSLLGGGMSSRLFQELREERGLCYSVFSTLMPFSDSGALIIYGGTSGGDADEFMRVTTDLIREAADHPSEAEVARARAQLKMSLMMALESPARRAEQMANHVLAFDRVLSRQEMADAIDAIGVEEVKQAAQTLFNAPPAVAAIGPVRKLSSADVLRARLGAAAA
jgi:predicted Zn-dependent peptidase